MSSSPNTSEEEGNQRTMGTEPPKNTPPYIPVADSKDQRPTLTGQAFDGTHQQVQTGLQAAGTNVTPVQPDSNNSLTQPIGQQHSHIGQPVNTGDFRGVSSGTKGGPGSSIPESPVGLPPHPQPTISTISSPNSVPELLDTMASCNHPAEMHASRPDTPLNHLEQGENYQSDNLSEPPSPLLDAHPRHQCHWHVNNGQELCGVTFSDVSELAEHISDDHLQQKDTNKHVTQEGGNIHFCHWDQCKHTKGFRDRHMLVNHTRVHTGAKPFVCNHPSCHPRKSFTRSPNLKKHNLAHTGKNPIPCSFPECTKTFADSWGQKRHMVVHTKDRPYPCGHPGCTKRYTQPNRLKEHSKKHTKLHDVQNAAHGDNIATKASTRSSMSNRAAYLQPTRTDSEQTASSAATYSLPIPASTVDGTTTSWSTSRTATLETQSSPASTSTYNHTSATVIASENLTQQFDAAAVGITAGRGTETTASALESATLSPIPTAAVSPAVAASQAVAAPLAVTASPAIAAPPGAEASPAVASSLAVAASPAAGSAATAFSTAAESYSANTINYS
ncbi:pair-rule protein odd-paired-like [Sycon ciliatum]|uniref:pair-rule protein odd-paired-like n=1 Tax=Sycon ciliatum TaxID=27933 RepID=UPI0031F6BE5F